MMDRYIEFLQFCLHGDRPLPESAKGIDWRGMKAWAESQAIAGIVYGGMTDGRAKLQVPFDVLMEWIGYAQQIECQNRLLNQKCVKVVEEYRGAGFECMVLKGQGNAVMYPNPLLRNPGDIDLLITNRSRREITQYVTKKEHLTGHHYHHIEYEEDDIPVEIHFYACSMSNPIYRKRLNRYLEGIAEKGKMTVGLPDGEGEIPVPSWEYNVVYQLAHMMHHFFDEGIGLRQFIDYYYLIKGHTDGRPMAEEGHTETTALELCSLATNGTQEITERRPMVEEGHTDSTEITDRRPMAEVGRVLRWMNLDRFAGAVMYVLKEVLGLEERYLIVPVDERRGKTLMEEVMKGGNFGRASGLTNHSMGMKYLLKTKRNLRLAREYPAEALCEPFFRTWHFLWRALKS